MPNIVAIMCMSLDGFAADPDDGAAEVFDEYFDSGNLDFHTVSAGHQPERGTTIPAAISCSIDASTGAIRR